MVRKAIRESCRVSHGRIPYAPQSVQTDAPPKPAILQEIKGKLVYFGTSMIQRLPKNGWGVPDATHDRRRRVGRIQGQ